jgi:hypothetical protein
MKLRLVGIALFQAFEEKVYGHAHGKLPGVLLRRAMESGGTLARTERPKKEQNDAFMKVSGALL